MSDQNPLWHAIVNPSAGGGKAGKLWPQIEAELIKRGVQVKTLLTEKLGDGIRLAKEAIESGARHLIAVGGDGTNHEVANGIMQQTVVPTTDVTQCLVPIGTGNDWLRTHGIENNPWKRIEDIIKNEPRLHNVGKVSYMNKGKEHIRYFVNVAGLAYDAWVTRASVEKRRFIKGKAMYMMLVFGCLASYKPIKGIVELADGTRVEDKFYTINAGISRWNGGGFLIAPTADPFSTTMGITIARTMSKLKVLSLTPTFYDGSFVKEKQVSVHNTERMTITHVDEPILVEADGEFLGETPVTLDILHAAWRVIT